MPLRNLTPFPAARFTGLTPDGKEHPVVALKVGYRLNVKPGEPGQGIAQLIEDAPVPLCATDRYAAEEGTSLLLEESDLVPFKPRCDVLVVGHAHAPGGIAAAQWWTQLRVSARPPHREIPDPPRLPRDISLSELRAWEDARQKAAHQRYLLTQYAPLIDKRLLVSGPSHFTPTLWGWRRTSPQPAARVALDWAHAYGGQSRVPNPAHADDPSTPPMWLDEVCYSNLRGTGWLEERYIDLNHKATRTYPDRIRAPQIEYPEHRMERVVEVRHPTGPTDARRMAAIAETYPHRPAGFGPVGKAWAPRLALAGTYDAAWLREQWPNPPTDTDFGFWNGAPVDQQAPLLPLGARIELRHLVKPSLANADGWFTVTLPEHRPFIVVPAIDGRVLVLPMLTDTVHIDTDAMSISLTHRMSLPGDYMDRAFEVRFEISPDEPLLRQSPSIVEVTS